MKRFSKKGSMQLSIEAIIILVIAMVLLGLGIAFIQNFFKTGEQKLLEPFDAIEFGCDPSTNNPITTSPTEIEVKSGDQREVKVCVYANQEADPAAIVSIKSCTSTAIDGSGGQVTAKPQILAAAQPIKRTETGGFNTILTAKNADDGSDLPVGTYICTLQAVVAEEYDAAADDIETIGTKQVTVTVT